MSDFDFSKVSGESFGDINEVFFKKNGKSILPQVVAPSDKVSAASIAKNIADTVENARKTATAGSGTTIIQISKDVIGGDDDLIVELTLLEEKRRNSSTIRNKHFIDINTGDEVKILEHTEMYNGTNLFTVKHMSNEKAVTYPRSMFVGRDKRFVPKEFYIREAERSIEDTIDKNASMIIELIQNTNNLTETADGKYLEVILDKSLDILGGMAVPDKVQIPVKRMFDMDYKLLMLEYVICLDSKIAALLFVDIWF